MTRLPTRVAAALAASAVAMTLLVGCDGSGGGPEAPATTTSDGLTAPGADLALGDTATVPRGDVARLELTVTGIEQGTQDDLQQVGLEDADQRTPYYVTYELTLVSGDGQGFDASRYLSAWVGDEQAGELTVFEKFPPCQQRVFPTDVSPGTTITSCLPFAVAEDSAPVDEVRFDDDVDYEMGDGGAITWR